MATEKRLIDINATIQNLESEIERYPTANSEDMPFEALKKSVVPKLVRNVINYLEKQPTVDAVEVVRCKDCKHWCYGYDCVGLCTVDVPDIDGVQREDFDFCSYGERKIDG